MLQLRRRRRRKQTKPFDRILRFILISFLNISEGFNSVWYWFVTSLLLIQQKQLNLF